MSPHVGQWGVLADTHCAMDLYGTVDDGQGHLWYKDLRLHNISQCLSTLNDNLLQILTSAISLKANLASF